MRAIIEIEIRWLADMQATPGVSGAKRRPAKHGCHIALKCYTDIAFGDGLVFTQVIWNDEPGGNIEHIEEHDLTVEDVEHVLSNLESQGVSRSSGQPCVFGDVPDGRYIIVVLEHVDHETVYPVTAYEVPEP